MREFRLGKNDKEHYSSLSEMGAAWGCKEKKKRTNDEGKLTKDRAKFAGTCRVCNHPLTFVGGNVMCCQNENCKGFKHTEMNEDGTERVWYTPVFRLLNDKGEEIAANLFE